MKTVSKTFQVTFSDGSSANRRFDEIGQYSSYDLARDAALAHLQRFYDGAMSAIKEVPDVDYAESEDWFIECSDRPYKGLVSINCLPLTMITKASSKPPYNSLSTEIVGGLARQAVEGL